ncbi:MAG: class I SAM-dependent methyltransferase [Methylococcales bacterium]
MSQRELFNVQNLPVFQNKMFADSKTALACAKGNMRLVQDNNTGLIFNAAFDSSLLDYDADYQNEQACSGLFRQHLNDVKTIIHRHFSDKNLLEVGCGKGYFLEYLQQAGYHITGIDPAYQGSNPNIIKTCFTADSGLAADALILRHVLEHIENPVAFLSTLAYANGGNGQIYIEVPCFDWIIEHRAWFDIFYEHVNYFRLADFQRLFGTIHEAGHLFGGQYLYVVADLASLQTPVCCSQDQVQFPSDFLADIDRLAALTKLKHNAIWGGASKGVIFALYMQRAGVSINWVIDINTAKQNKFIAGSGLKVSAPDEALSQLQQGDNIFVMNSNYLPEIIAASHNQFTYLQVDHREL